MAVAAFTVKSNANGLPRRLAKAFCEGTGCQKTLRLSIDDRLT